jgi:predicted O-methyltransferase YrrM
LTEQANAWALLPSALELVVGAVAGGCRNVVECGSGESTVAIAKLLAERGDGTLHSLEHDSHWAERTRQRLAARGLTRRVELIEAQLRPHGLGAGDWYDLGALERLPHGIDLLLVDGPPGDLGPDGQVRYPALPLLAPRLAEGALVLLDDIDRPGELSVLERWRRELGTEFELRPEERLAIGVFSGPAELERLSEREK